MTWMKKPCVLQPILLLIQTNVKASYEDSVYVAGGVQKDLDVLVHETDLTCG